jgi:hypothetical protein
MARPKKPNSELKDQRIPIMMTEAELQAIDDWMFKNRLRSRGEAIRRLCQIGMDHETRDVGLNDALRRLFAVIPDVLGLMPKRASKAGGIIATDEAAMVIDRLYSASLQMMLLLGAKQHTTAELLSADLEKIGLKSAELKENLDALRAGFDETDPKAFVARVIETFTKGKLVRLEDEMDRD